MIQTSINSEYELLDLDSSNKSFSDPWIDEFSFETLETFLVERFDLVDSFLRMTLAFFTNPLIFLVEQAAFS